MTHSTTAKKRRYDAIESNCPTDNLDLVHDSFDAIDLRYCFLRQLSVKKAVQPTLQHENSIIVLAKYVSQGWARGCTEAGFRNCGNFKRADILLHLDGHRETVSLD